MKTVSLAAVVLFAFYALAAEDAPPDPREAWVAMVTEIQAARTAYEYDRANQLQEQHTAAFLEAWETSGAKAEGEQLLFLGRFYGAALRLRPALVAFRACAADEGLAAPVRGEARRSFVGMAAALVNEEGTSEELAAKLAAEAAGMVEAMAGPELAPQRAQMRMGLAAILDRLSKKDEAILQLGTAGEEYPPLAFGVAQLSVPILSRGVIQMDAYPALRERGQALLERLAGIHETFVESLRKQGNAALADRQTPMADRIRGYGRRLDLLGKPAPDWDLVRAYGRTRSIADHEGKVRAVVFWKTEDGWCTSSLPVLRSLAADYTDRDLVLVGLTVPANMVVSSDFEQDGDLQEKAAEAEPVTLHIPYGGDDEEVAEYRKKEQELIGRFIENHGITWDVVLIGENQHWERFAVAAWPSVVVIDRQGRVRYFLQRLLQPDRPRDVAQFRGILDALLAEK